jgi:ribosomal protein L24
MTAITSFVRAALTIPTGKNGKVSKQNEKAASVMCEASATAIISAAINGKGAVKKLAIAQLQGLHSVESFTNRDEIDGGEWADFLQALVARHGIATFNPSTMKGKRGVVAYLNTTRTAIEVKGASDDWTKALSARMEAVEEDLFHAERLLDIANIKASLAAAAAAEHEGVAA